MIEKSQYDVAVVGAGLSGLTAAYRLKQEGFNVIVLEAKDRVGGRLLNTRLDNGAVIDAGGSFVAPQQKNVQRLLREFDLHTTPQHREGRGVCLQNGKVSQFEGEMPPLGPLAMFDMAQAAWRLDRAARRIFRRPQERTRFDSISFEAWLRANTFSADARFLFNIICATSFGRRCDEVSALAVMIHIASAGDLQTLIGVEGAGLDSRIAEGAAALPMRLAHALSPNLHLNHPVKTIERDQNGATLISTSDVFRARKVIVAVDPEIAGRIVHTPSLPALRRETERRFSMGSGFKIHIAYPRPFWRDEGLSGSAVADEGLVRIVFDVSNPAHPSGILMTFVGLAYTDVPELLDSDAGESRQQRIVQDLVRLFGPEAGTPEAYSEQNWSTEPYQAGCVPGPGCGVITGAGDSLVQPVGPIHWAGAETSEVWEGHMDGAIVAGERAAAEIAHSLRRGAPLAA